jgi:hypothetical protein
MKTKMNVNQIAQMSIAAAALFFFAGIMPVQAETKSTNSNNQEISAAAGRLDNLNSEIETSIRFVAPSVSTAEEMMVMETEAAEARLENLSNSIQNSVRFVAPAVDANAEALENEVNQAVERLENLNLAIEDTIRFQAPAAHEVENTL